jgi:hypothetical protein
MARVGRLAGAILAETGGAYYLVGNPKQPCDWRAAGFEPPGELDACVRPAVPLVRCPATAPAIAADRELAPAAPLVLETPVLELDVEGEALAALLAGCFVIPRTGSVSERLWRLVIGQTDETDQTDQTDEAGGDPAPPPATIAARWLGELPPTIWRIVRDSVLRCT